MRKGHRILIIIMILVAFSCATCKNRADEKSMHIIKTMTITEKIGQMLMLGVPDKKLTKNSASIIDKYLPGGIILFGYNLGNADEIKKYIDDMQQSAVSKYNIPLFISIDQEGGRVKRITDGVTQFPGNMAFGVVNDENLAYEAARILGIELRKIGVNMNLAPALDVNNNPSNPVINTRSFGSDVKTVSLMGTAYIKGLQKSGCIAVGKHFPGHGDTDKDSHLTLPVIHHDINRLHEIEFPPFITAINNDLEAVMTAHISFPEILKDNSPATISRLFLTDILREEMGFKGLIMTDDMEMNAVSKAMDLGDGAVKSILAGADIILISTHGKSLEIISKAILKAVDEGVIPVSRIDESLKRIIELKLKYNIMEIKDSRIICSSIKYSQKELDLLKKADQLNSKVSKEAVYFYSNNQSRFEPLTESVAQKIFISSNDYFIKEIENKFACLKNSKYLLFKSEKEYIKFIAKQLQIEKENNILTNAVIYYQFDKINEELLNKASVICENFDAKLYLLCTGNPFILRSVKDLPPTLITFSNTTESIKQMFLCLCGEFKPKDKINVFIGLENK